MHAASCRVLALADGVRLEAEIFEHSVNELQGLREEGWLHQRSCALCRKFAVLKAEMPR